jgi:hypothetical protein
VPPKIIIGHPPTGVATEKLKIDCEFTALANMGRS